MKIMILFMTISLLTPINQHTYAKDMPKTALYQLEKINGGTLDLKWNTETNTPSKLTGNLSLPSKHSPEWIAYEFLNKYRKLYGLQQPSRDMKVIKVERHPDKTIVHLQHLLFKTPVWEDWLVIEMNLDGGIRQIEGTIHPYLEKQLFNRPMIPAISEKQAIKKAAASVHGELVNEPKAARYYLSTRPGTPLIYVVNLRPNNREI